MKSREPWITVNSVSDLPKECGYYWVVPRDIGETRLMEIHRITKFGYIFNECIIDGVCYEDPIKVNIIAWKKAHIPLYIKEE